MRSVISVLIVFAVGCGSDEKSAPSTTIPGTAFLTAEDFKYTESKLEANTAAEVQSFMYTATDLYANNAPEDDSDATDKCIEEMSDTIPIEAGELVLTIDGTIDLTECFKKDTNFFALNPKATARVAQILTCTKGNLSAFNGKKNSSLPDSIFCGEGGEARFTSNLTLVVSMKGTRSDGKAIEFETRSVVGTNTAAVTACAGTVASGVMTFDDGCLVTSKTTILKSLVDGVAQEGQGKEDFDQLAFNGLKQKVDETSQYFSQGTIIVRKNTWTGTVTYTDVAKAPEWKMTSGSQSTTGTLGKAPTATLRLDARPASGLPAVTKRAAKNALKALLDRNFEPAF
jgi:hypothetical protein